MVVQRDPSLTMQALWANMVSDMCTLADCHASRVRGLLQIDASRAPVLCVARGPHTLFRIVKVTWWQNDVLLSFSCTVVWPAMYTCPQPPHVRTLSCLLVSVITEAAATRCSRGIFPNIPRAVITPASIFRLLIAWAGLHAR